MAFWIIGDNMRTMTVRRNARRKPAKRRTAARRAAPRSTVVNIAAPARRRRRASTATRRRTGLAQVRRRRVARTKPLGMGELMGMGAVGAAGAFATEYALERMPILHEKIESETGRAFAKAGVSTGIALVAVGLTRKKKVRARKMVNAAAIGALSASFLKLGHTLYNEHVAKNGTALPDNSGDESEGVDGILPNAGRVVPFNGINAPARRGSGIRAPARRGVGYVSPTRYAGQMVDINRGTVDALDNSLNGML